MRHNKAPASQGFFFYNNNDKGDCMKIEIYSKDGCAYCVRAKNHFSSHGLEYVEHDLMAEGMKASLQDRLPEGYVLRQVPQIFIDDVHIGGYMEMVEWFLARTRLKDELL
jgi:glutaredoxin 3